MLLNQADHWFALCIKERANWTCEYCGKVYPRGSNKSLNCCHYQGRGAWATRYEPQNCFCFCYSHHAYLDSRKGTFERFFKEKRGVDVYDLVLEKSDNIDLAKEIHRTKGKGEIADYFQGIYEAMLKAREEGAMHRFEFAGWM